MWGRLCVVHDPRPRVEEPTREQPTREQQQRTRPTMMSRKHDVGQIRLGVMPLWSNNFVQYATTQNHGITIQSCVALQLPQPEIVESDLQFHNTVFCLQRCKHHTCCRDQLR